MYISNQMSTPMQMTGELDAERIGGIIYKHASFRAFTRGQLRKSGIHRVLNRLDRVVAAVCKEFSLNPGSSLYLAVFSNTRCNELYYFLIYDDSCGTHQAKYSILNCSGKYIPLMPYGPWHSFGMEQSDLVTMQALGKQAYEYWIHTQNISFPWDNKPKNKQEMSTLSCFYHIWNHTEKMQWV
eukprot:260532_1